MIPLEVREKVTEIIQAIVDNPELVLEDATTAHDVDRWDSFNHIQIVVAIEREFGVRFKTHELETLGNFGELVFLLNEKLAQR